MSLRKFYVPEFFSVQLVAISRPFSIALSLSLLNAKRFDFPFRQIFHTSIVDKIWIVCCHGKILKFCANITFSLSFRARSCNANCLHYLSLSLWLHDYALSMRMSCASFIATREWRREESKVGMRQYNWVCCMRLSMGLSNEFSFQW